MTEDAMKLAREVAEETGATDSVGLVARMLARAVLDLHAENERLMSLDAKRCEYIEQLNQREMSGMADWLKLREENASLRAALKEALDAWTDAACNCQTCHDAKHVADWKHREVDRIAEMRKEFGL